MKIKLTPRKDGNSIRIFADVFPNESGEIDGLTAERLRFRLVKLYEQDAPNDGLFMVPLADAVEFANEILKIAQEEQE